MKNPYTVLLLYPDYCKMNNSKTYEAHVLAKSPEQAAFFAQHEAWVDNESEVEELNKKDFEVLAVYEGHLENLNVY